MEGEHIGPRSVEIQSTPIDPLLFVATDKGAHTLEDPSLDSDHEHDHEYMFAMHDHIDPIAEEKEEQKFDTSSKRLEDFKIINLLGVGAYGQVFLVLEETSSTLFAMKVIKKRDIMKKNLVRYTKSERNVLIAVDHPFIVTLRFAFQTEQRLYLIMDYIPGGELFTRLNEQYRLVEEHAVFYAAEIVLVFEHLHAQNVIYRDLKPENILIQKDGHVCLTDFGFAKHEHEDKSYTFCGTVWYMAPEMVEKKRGYGKAVDWWSLGTLIFEMLTGKTPFGGGNRKEIQRRILESKVKLPDFLSLPAKNLLKKLLDKNCEKRLGAKGAAEVKKHKFFADIDWKKLIERKMKPPFIPELHSADDIRHFHPPTLASSITPSPLPESFQDQFIGFSYDCERLP